MDLATKYNTAVKSALKEAALGEPFDYSVSGPSIWDFKDEQGNVIGRQPAWFVIVSIHDSNPGAPDLGRGLPVPGIVPPLDMVKAAAVALLEKLREDRAGKQNDELAQARAAFAAQMAQAKS